jgi:hypothetical protein
MVVSLEICFTLILLVLGIELYLQSLVLCFHVTDIVVNTSISDIDVSEAFLAHACEQLSGCRFQHNIISEHTCNCVHFRGQFVILRMKHSFSVVSMSIQTVELDVKNNPVIFLKLFMQLDQLEVNFYSVQTLHISDGATISQQGSLGLQSFQETSFLWSHEHAPKCSSMVHAESFLQYFLSGILAEAVEGD